MAATSTVTIRAARPSDKRAVRALCSRIWGDDYIVGVFDEWVRDRRGRLWVAVADGRVVGVAKLTLLGDSEAWLHALRVDPDHRRRGVATALLEHRIARARQFGARVARLDTADDNVAVRRLMRRYRFHLRQRSTYFEAPARAVEPPRRATRDEIDALWELAQRGDGLLHLAYTWRRLTKEDVARAIRSGNCFAAGPEGKPTAVSIAEIHRPGRGGHGHRPRIALRALGGSGPGVRALLRAATGLARREHLTRVGVPVPSALWRAARSARYRSPWNEAMLVFEKRLR